MGMTRHASVAAGERDSRPNGAEQPLKRVAARRREMARQRDARDGRSNGVADQVTVVATICRRECSRCQYARGRPPSAAAAARSLPAAASPAGASGPRRGCRSRRRTARADAVAGDRLQFGCHVRGSSVGTSARCARSTMTVGLPAARQRSHGPDISRAVGQRRFSATSHAAMQSVKASSVVTIAGDGDVAARAAAARCRRRGRSARARAPARSRCALGTYGRVAANAARICGKPLVGRQPAETAEDDRVGRDAVIASRAREAGGASSAVDTAIPCQGELHVTRGVGNVDGELCRRARGCGPRRASRRAATSRVIGQS